MTIMTQQQKLQEVRDFIVAAVPEIMELKFGCRAERHGRTWYFNGDTWNIPDTPGSYSVGFFEGNEILGRPIGLEDVLRAIDKYKKPNFGTVATNGWMHFGTDRCFWTLGKDLAWHAEHSPETIDFIHSILIK